MNTIEILATILVALLVIKLVVVIYSPKKWMRFAKKLYSRPKPLMWISAALSMYVLYLLTSMGVTIVEIFAVSLFFVLLMLVSIAPYGKEMMKWADSLDMNKMIKKGWLGILLWVLMLGWAIKELFL